MGEEDKGKKYYCGMTELSGRFRNAADSEGQCAGDGGRGRDTLRY